MCILGGGGQGGAREWVAAHGEADDDEWVPCCAASAINGETACTCWVAVYDLQQADPVVEADLRLADLDVMGRACADCAYRPDSIERADEYHAEKLMGLAFKAATPFFCHEGIRRPVTWRHPDGRTVAGDPTDYDPPIVGGVPFRANGLPGYLCRGWAVRYAAHQAELQAAELEAAR